MLDGRGPVAGRQSVAVPDPGERPHRCERRQATDRCEFLRPEEADGSSGVDDVVPPSTRRDDEVDVSIGVADGLAVDDPEVDRRAVVQLWRLYLGVDAQRCRDGQRVPRTVGEPPAISRAHDVVGRDRRERQRHADRTISVEHHLMVVVERSQPAVERLESAGGRRQHAATGHHAGSGETRVDRATQFPVRVVERHRPTLRHRSHLGRGIGASGPRFRFS